MIRRLHATIVDLLKAMPVAMGVPAFRVYDKALKVARRDYRAETYFKAALYCDPHDFIQRMILHFGVWEPEVSRVIEHTLRPGDVFVDVGANIGYDTLLASRCVGSGGRVVAIEASPGTYALLMRNLGLNDSANVRAVNVAVSDRRATLDLYEMSKHNIGAATTLPARGGRRSASVEALPLGEILSDEEIGRLRLIKLDIEGAEPPVLQNLLDGLARYPADLNVIVEASPRDDHEAWQGVFDRLRQAGFVAYAIENSYDVGWYLAWRRHKALCRTDVLPDYQGDLLFTRSMPPRALLAA